MLFLLNRLYLSGKDYTLSTAVAFSSVIKNKQYKRRFMQAIMITCSNKHLINIK